AETVVTQRDLERALARIHAQLEGQGSAPRGAGADSYAPPRRSNGWHRGLYRDRRKRLIGGVCAGLARAYGVERWVARLIAVTLLIFVPHIVVPLYLGALLVLAPLPHAEAERRSLGLEVPAAAQPAFTSAPPAPRFSARSLRARFRELELRLQRMERTVTSRQFRLDRAFQRLEKEGEAPQESP
ncbi:MAG: PspC domain-containing protein, partial [Pseudomonadales bacterium]